MSNASPPRSRILSPDIWEAARSDLHRWAEMIGALEEEMMAVDVEIARAKRDGIANRLMTVPGIGPAIATALEALARRQKLSSLGATLRPGPA